VIKTYPGGVFSSYLDERLSADDRLGQGQGVRRPQQGEPAGLRRLEATVDEKIG